MRPPALEIRLILSAPGMGWDYTVRKWGEPIAAGDGFPQPGAALMAAVAETKAYATVPPAPTIDDDEGGDE